jgi:hypothetical protein
VLVVYVATARHVVIGARAYGPLYLRLNLRSELLGPGAPGYVDRPIAPDAWVEHKDTDIAIATLGGCPPQVDFRWVQQEILASDEYVAAHEIGVGDEVFFAGLFSPHPGIERFQPIVRFGTLSMMPHEKVTIEIEPRTPKDVDAYLVEARSWGGHSGSPTFIYYPPDRRPGAVMLGGTPALLGLVSAHFPIRKNAVLRDSLDSTPANENAGIAVVVPAQGIIDLLNREVLVEDREERKKEVEAGRPAPTPDSGLPEGYTREDFISDLEKATKPLPEGEKPDPKKS